MRRNNRIPKRSLFRHILLLGLLLAVVGSTGGCSGGLLVHRGPLWFEKPFIAMREKKWREKAERDWKNYDANVKEIFRLNQEIPAQCPPPRTGSRWATEKLIRDRLSWVALRDEADAGDALAQVEMARALYSLARQYSNPHTHARWIEWGLFYARCAAAQDVRGLGILGIYQWNLLDKPVEGEQTLRQAARGGVLEAVALLHDNVVDCAPIISGDEEEALTEYYVERNQWKRKYQEDLSKYKKSEFSLYYNPVTGWKIDSFRDLYDNFWRIPGRDPILHGNKPSELDPYNGTYFLPQPQPWPEFDKLVPTLAELRSPARQAALYKELAGMWKDLPPCSSDGVEFRRGGTFFFHDPAKPLFINLRHVRRHKELADTGGNWEVQAQLGQRLIRYAERLPELASVLDKPIRHYYGCAVRRRGVSPYDVDWLAKYLEKKGDCAAMEQVLRLGACTADDEVTRNIPADKLTELYWGDNYYKYHEASTAMEKRVARAETVEELSAIIPPLDLYLEKGKCVARNRYDPSTMTPNLTPDKDTAQDDDRGTAQNKDRGKSPGAH